MRPRRDALGAAERKNRLRHVEFDDPVKPPRYKAREIAARFGIRVPALLRSVQRSVQIRVERAYVSEISPIRVEDSENTVLLRVCGKACNVADPLVRILDEAAP